MANAMKKPAKNSSSVRKEHESSSGGKIHRYCKTPEGGGCKAGSQGDCDRDQSSEIDGQDCDSSNAEKNGSQGSSRQAGTCSSAQSDCGASQKVTSSRRKSGFREIEDFRDHQETRNQDR